METIGSLIIIIGWVITFVCWVIWRVHQNDVRIKKLCPHKELEYVGWFEMKCELCGEIKDYWCFKDDLTRKVKDYKICRTISLKQFIKEED